MYLLHPAPSADCIGCAVGDILEVLDGIAPETIALSLDVAGRRGPEGVWHVNLRAAPPYSAVANGEAETAAELATARSLPPVSLEEDPVWADVPTPASSCSPTPNMLPSPISTRVRHDLRRSEAD